MSRGSGGGPRVLAKPYGDRVKEPKIKNKSELESVLRYIETYHKRRETYRQKKAAGDASAKAPKFSFPFARYSDRQVVEALRQLFHGKCAYCESRYAGTQPMDVEHWRPKGKIAEPGEPEIVPGYYWLAAEWTNLLPSCIDCNRGRKLVDVFEREKAKKAGKARVPRITLGKKNQFPLQEGSKRITRHQQDPECEAETPLLINPCLEDPERLLRYDDDGLILPRSSDAQSLDYRKAATSIRVYALNRADLVAERRALVLRFDHRIELIRALAEVKRKLAANGLDELKDTLADLIAAEIDVLLAMRASREPFAGLSRQLVRDADPGLAQATWRGKIDSASSG